MNADELRRELDLARINNRSDRVAEILAELDGPSRGDLETTEAAKGETTAVKRAPRKK